MISSDDKNVISQLVSDNKTPGNYHYTIDKLLNDDNIILKSNDMLVVNNEIKQLILNNLISQERNKIPDHKILGKINKDILAAHSKIIEYVNYIIKENERDKDKIEKNIKKDINKFYNLFDKRDELYIKYLNNFTTEKKKYNLLYAKSLALKVTNISIKSNPDRLIIYVLIYLFEYCSYLCFNNKSIYCERLKLYGIYKDLDKDLDFIIYKDTALTFKNVDENYFQKKRLRSIRNIEEQVLSLPSTTTQPKDKDGKPITPTISYSGGNDYKPIQVKLENKQFLIFEDYEKILNLYKSFLVVYPVLFTITI